MPGGGVCQLSWADLQAGQLRSTSGPMAFNVGKSGPGSDVGPSPRNLAQRQQQSMSVFLDDETSPAGTSSGYKGLRAPARSPEMRLGRKCALIGDWSHAETQSAGIPAESRRAWICREKQPGRMVSSVYSSRHRSPVRVHSLTVRKHRQSKFRQGLSGNFEG